MTSQTSSHDAPPEWRAVIAAGDADALADWLQAGLHLDLDVATATRDFAASLVNSDPVLAHRVSGALLAAALRRSATRRSWRGSSALDRVELHGILSVAWRSRAETSAYVGKQGEARQAYAAASRHADRHGDPALRGQILVGRIGLLAALGRSVDSNRLVPEAARLLRAAGDLNYLARLHMNLGNAACHREEFETACTEFARASELFDGIGQSGPVRVGLKMNQGIAYTELSQVVPARRAFLEVEEKSAELGLTHFVAQAQFNRGFLEGYFGDYRTALRLLEDADRAFKAEGAMELTAGTELARAEIYIELGMGQEARELARAAASTYDRVEMVLDAALCRFAEARALALRRDLAGAAQLLMQLDEFYREQRIRSRRARVRLELARVLLTQNELDSAEKVALRALKTLQGLRTGIAVAQARTLLAEVKLRRDRAGEAEAVLSPVLGDADQFPIRERIALWHLAGLVADGMGKRAEAGRRFARAVRALESQRQLIPGVELRARAFEGHARVYRDRIAHEVRSRRHRFESLFALVESARARAFRERGATAGSASGSSDETESLRARMGSLVRRMERTEFESDRETAGRVVPELRREIVELERRIMSARRAEAVRSERASSPNAYDGVGTANPDDLERALGAGEVLIEYFVLADRILALVLGGGERRVVVLDTPPEAVRAVMQSFQTQLETLALTADRPVLNLPFLRRAADSLLERMYEALLRPLEVANSPRLLLVPHGFLHRIPFECLRGPDGYLVDRCAIRRSPTADFLLRGSSDRGDRPPPARVILSGLIDGGPAFVESELEAVRRAFGDRKTILMRDPTAGELLDAIASADWIHLSTHGAFREDNPLFSRLSTRGGALFLIDVLERRTDAALVVLSACNSGQVFAGEGDDLSGVAHGFLAAGARQLVASTWRVHDQATRDWMERFYLELVGLDPLNQGGSRPDSGEALRRASVQTREKWNHPFYWGAFCLHG